ncbi:replication factor A protein [Trifolium repens]|nr:replication factor A protein [Trifolium repens]
MSRLFDMLGVLYPRREPWRIKVRVISLWTVNSVFRSNQVNSLDMVLIDEKGDKIQASVRRQLIYLFLSKIVEGNIYKMSHFIVFPTDDRYRTTFYPYKLMFTMKTKVRNCPNHTIDRYGFSYTNINQICSFGADYCYLIDVIGVVTGITIEREYIHDAKMTRMIILELTDHSGKVECVLFGEYVRLFQELIAENNGKLPVIVIQFGKVKLFRDKVSIQNVDFATRIYFDPPTQDVLAFKNGISLHQVNYGVDISLIDPPNSILFEDEFLAKYPKRTISQLVNGSEDGIYVVSGVVTGVVGGEDWWYPTCSCLKIVSREPRGYYCEACVKYFLHMVPRYRVKVNVEDATGQAVFVLFELDMYNLIDKNRIVVRIPDEAHFQTVVDPKEKLISVPWSFVEVWKRANLPHCGVKISSGGKSINARFCVSDDAFMFYADKVAEFFGFAEPTRVTMTYILSENTFFLDVVGDPGTEESSNENEIVSLTSSGDESDYDEGDDQLNDYQNQQMIVYNEDVNAHYETFHTVTWSKTVTESMAAYRSKQSLHFMKFICRRFLQNQHIMLLKCEETGFSYMCKVESSKKADEHGVFLKRIGEGWYKFRDEHKLKVGDNLWFEMSFYPYVLKVWIDRKK